MSAKAGDGILVDLRSAFALFIYEMKSNDVVLKPTYVIEVDGVLVPLDRRPCIEIVT
jgi:hypothetical protein